MRKDRRELVASRKAAAKAAREEKRKAQKAAKDKKRKVQKAEKAAKTVTKSENGAFDPNAGT